MVYCTYTCRPHLQLLKQRHTVGFTAPAILALESLSQSTRTLGFYPWLTWWGQLPIDAATLYPRSARPHEAIAVPHTEPQGHPQTPAARQVQWAAGSAAYEGLCIRRHTDAEWVRCRQPTLDDCVIAVIVYVENSLMIVGMFVTS